MIGWSVAAIAGQGAGGVAGGESETGRHVQYRRPDLRQRVHGAAARLNGFRWCAPNPRLTRISHHNLPGDQGRVGRQ